MTLIYPVSSPAIRPTPQASTRFSGPPASTPSLSPEDQKVLNNPLLTIGTHSYTGHQLLVRVKTALDKRTVMDKVFDIAVFPQHIFQDRNLYDHVKPGFIRDAFNNLIRQGFLRVADGDLFNTGYKLTQKGQTYLRQHPTPRT